MAIFQSKTHTFRKNLGRFSVNEGSWGCTCDKCGKAVAKWAEEAGDASENAYKEGFAAVATGPTHKGFPMMWLCAGCNATRVAADKRKK